MKTLILLPFTVLVLLSTSCTMLVENPVGPHHHDSYVMIESNTCWEGEIDGWAISGYGDHIFYTEADCVGLEKCTCCGFVQLTVYRYGCEETSYTNAEYGEVWICE